MVEAEVEAKAEAKEDKVAETKNGVDFIRASTCGRTVQATKKDHATTVERIKGVNHTTLSSNSSSSSRRWHSCLLL